MHCLFLDEWENLNISSVPLSSKVQTRQVFQVQGADIDHVDFEKNMQAMFFVKWLL